MLAVGAGCGTLPDQPWSAKPYREVVPSGSRPASLNPPGGHLAFGPACRAAIVGRQPNRCLSRLLVCRLASGHWPHRSVPRMVLKQFSSDPPDSGPWGDARTAWINAGLWGEPPTAVAGCNYGAVLHDSAAGGAKLRQIDQPAERPSSSSRCRPGEALPRRRSRSAAGAGSQPVSDALFLQGLLRECPDRGRSWPTLQALWSFPSDRAALITLGWRRRNSPWPD